MKRWQSMAVTVPSSGGLLQARHGADSPNPFSSANILERNWNV